MRRRLALYCTATAAATTAAAISCSTFRGTAAFPLTAPPVRRGETCLRMASVVEEGVRTKVNGDIDASSMMGDLGDAEQHSSVRSTVEAEGRKGGGATTPREDVVGDRDNITGVRKDRKNDGSGAAEGDESERGISDRGKTLISQVVASSSSSSPFPSLRKVLREASSSGKDGRGGRKGPNYKEDQTVITSALRTVERDTTLLDDLASTQPQLSLADAGMLLGAVLASGVGPVFFPATEVTAVLAPAAAAFTASLTMGSEYTGRVAVAEGKEIAANAIQCAAEAEALLANAERVKAITPLCVGVGATCASLTLLAPSIIDNLGLGGGIGASSGDIMITELLLLCPVVSVLAAAVANLALEETSDFAGRAINVGVRRFSKSGIVGQTWLSTTQQIERNSNSKTDRWWSFTGSVLPAPIIGSILGGPSLSAKCIVVAALATAQSAYYLIEVEGVLARAQDAVALKARSAAVCETYASQGARNAAILPFTSALSAFCAPATAAVIELHLARTIRTLYGTVGEVAAVSTFPILAAAFAGAGAVSKARCEVDAEAAAQAACTLALEYDGLNEDEDPVLTPFQEVWDLLRLAVTSGVDSVRKGVMGPIANIWRIGRSAILGYRWKKSRNERGKAVDGTEALA